MDSHAKELIARGDRLFTKKGTLDSLRQEIALQVYPIRANFTGELVLGDEFASHLFDSSPLLAHRDLSNAFSSMLRPRGQPWNKAAFEDEELSKAPGVADFLDTITKTMRRAMYRGSAQFTRATKEGDGDFAAFGECIITVEVNAAKDGLIYRAHHPKDCAWVESENGAIDTMFRNIVLSARQMKQRWGEKAIHAEVRKACEKEPDREFKVRHVMMPAADYEYVNRKRTPKGADYVSIYTDCENEHLISEEPSFEFRYVAPRWQTIPGSQYGVSPAAMISLADSRMIQAMARVMLEAGEKSVDPPIVATEEAVRGDINLYGGGVTWVDRDYDERLGAAVQPIELGKNVRLGIDMLERTRFMIQDAWYLTKLSLPQQGAKTAYETAQLVEEFIRAAIPLFEPLESSYNLPLLDETATILARVGAFGPPDSWPDEVFDAFGKARNLTFTFSNPLQDAIEKAKTYQFQNVIGMAQMAREIDPAAGHDLNVRAGLRDAVQGSGAPASWLIDKEEADAAADQEKQAAQAMQLAQGASVAGEAVKNVGQGVAAMQPPQDMKRAT